jgi:hypothetical protein
MKFSRLTEYLRKINLLAPLSFDQQVWGAKSLMDLYQPISFFYLAEADNGGVMTTYWLGSQDGLTYKITVDTNGESTGPTQSNSPNTVPFGYPPLISCLQAVKILENVGITAAWQNCSLEQLTPGNITYYFTFLQHDPVTVNAMTGEIE